MWYTLEVQPINITFNIASVLAKSNISYELAGSTVIFKYAGQKPVTHIDVEMIFTPKERRLEYFSLSRAGSVFSGGPDHLCFYDGCTWDEWCEYGVALNNLYAIDKKSESKIRVYGTMTKYFEFSVGGIKPHTGTYDVSFAQGYGSAEPE